MRSFKKILFFLYFLPACLFAQVSFTDSDLPIIVINTGGQGINDSTRIVADMGIIYNGPGNRNYMVNPFNHYVGKISIEIRGSTSQQYPKKSYGLETQDILGNNLDTALLGMPSENDWILYGAYPDKTLMRNEITYDMFRQMGHYDARYVYAELVIDGDYRGVYSFMEKVKRDKNRVDIAKLTPADTIGDELTGGYIIKVDKLTGSSDTYWTSIANAGVKYLYHDPQDIELHPTQLDYIKDYVTNFEMVMQSAGFANSFTGYPAIIDVNSFIDFMIMQELGRTVDGYRSSSFMYKEKDSQGGLLHAGPMWDFNLSYGNADYCDAYDTAGYQFNFNTVCPSFSSYIPFFWERFLEDTNYNTQLQCRWQQLRASVFHQDSINQRIDAIALKLNESKTRNFARWPILGVYVNWNYFVGNTYQEELDYLKYWFSARMSWLDAHWPGHCNQVYLGATELADMPPHQVYPNPATDYFFIKVYPPMEVKDANFLLINETGQVVLQQNHISANELAVYRNQLSSGLYFYRFWSAQFSIQGKIVFADR
jgi:hypothetical protein